MSCQIILSVLVFFLARCTQTQYTERFGDFPAPRSSISHSQYNPRQTFYIDRSPNAHPLLDTRFRQSSRSQGPRIDIDTIRAPQSFSSQISGAPASRLTGRNDFIHPQSLRLSSAPPTSFADFPSSPYDSRDEEDSDRVINPTRQNAHKFFPVDDFTYDDGSVTSAGFPENFLGDLGSAPFDEQRQCRPPKKCLKTKYRSADGSCNNLKNTEWGSAGTPYGRLLPPKYADGVHAPPLSLTGNPLPEPRVLSRTLLPAMRRDDKILSLAAMQWGQIVTHDMSLAMDTLPNARAPECCNPTGGPLFDRLSKGEPCFPIVVPQDDPMFMKYRQKCMEFLRTTTDRQRGCNSGRHAKPLSAVSHWLDGSTVYGDSEQAMRNLRSGRGGRLNVEVRGGKMWPQTNTNASLTCARPAPEQVCYQTGDIRVNQSPQLALVQILLFREHNRIAGALSLVNKHWDDETLFQETRRIVIAEIQHITYFEWLPAFSGEKLENFDDDYDPNVDPSVLNEHAQGAFRYFHTNIQGRLLLMSERRFSEGNIRLPEHMQDVSILEAGVFEDLARGLTTQAQHGVDRFHSHEVTENLFRRPENPAFGFDLKSLDIQRGRDHGLASYNDYRQHCGLRRAKHFRDFSDLIDLEAVRRLESHYEHPDDVDLAVGAALEHDDLGAVGPTFRCILREQFRRTRVADRFFFDRNHRKTGFTQEQLIEIRKSNFARIVCDNADGVFTMQPSAFRQLSKINPLVPCSELEAIPIVNLNAWRDMGSKYSEYSR